MAIKHLLVDFDGVIRHWSNDDRSIEIKYSLPENSISSVAFSNELLVPAIRGYISDAVWRENISSRLARLHPESKARNAVTEWSKSTGAIDNDILELFGSCAGIDLSLVTNATSRLQSDLLDHGIVDAFKHIFNSSQMGAIKPEPQFFTYVLEQLGSKSSETVFIDDAQENIKTAQYLGIESHQFTGIESLKMFLTKVF